MQAQLSHKEVRSLFGALVDADLPPMEERRLRVHLDDCADCRTGWERYERAVTLVRGTQREKAPPSLASNILRRTRRQRIQGMRGLHLAHLHHRVPVEAVIPVLLGVLVAVMLMLLAPQ